MARSAILGNGSLTVGIDENGLVHDFYYPYVGLENMNNSRADPHYIGVWINGVFSWLHDENWKNSVKIHQHAMITQTRHTNDNAAVSISIETFVDHSSDTLVRHVVVHNKNKLPIDVRLFFHQVFQISNEGRSDTAMYVPDDHYILDYKGKCTLLINAALEDGTQFDQFAVGNYGIEGKDGTFRDAEDGELSMNAVEHAGVDSTIRLQFTIEPKQSKSANYWVVAASSHEAARKRNKMIISKGIPSLLHDQLLHWQDWLSPAKEQLESLSPEYRKATITSLLTIKSHIDKRGGIIASCDSSIYNYGRDYYSYVWPRDGSFVIWPLIRLGIYEEPRNFFIFCKDVLSEDGYMMHKYQPDRAVGSTWHPLVHGDHAELAIQEDETALVIFMLGEYAEYSGDYGFAKSLYLDLVQPATNFISEYLDNETGLPHPSYDLWEEKFLSSTFSSGASYAALKVAIDFAERFNFPDDATQWTAIAQKIKSNVDTYYDSDRNAFIKGFTLDDKNVIVKDKTLDVSSLYSSFKFGFASSSEQIAKTAKLVESELLDNSPSGGSPRYENDTYFREKAQYKGNPWFVTTLWMAQFYIKVGQVDKAQHYIDWTIKHALDSGALSEQIDPENGDTVGVTPLVWSHAELINTILDSAAETD